MSTAAVEGGHPDLVVDRLRVELGRIYRSLGEDVAATGVGCALSGRCCRFQEYDHTLFLSGMEALLLVIDAPPPSRPLDDGASCPWQDQAGRCTAREARPLGCRVYYCDPSYQEAGQEIAERHIAALKRLADRLNVPWDYQPLHQHLRHFGLPTEKRTPGQS